MHAKKNENKNIKIYERHLVSAPKKMKYGVRPKYGGKAGDRHSGSSGVPVGSPGDAAAALFFRLIRLYYKYSPVRDCRIYTLTRFSGPEVLIFA